MSLPTIVEDILEQNSEYIRNAAKEAAEYFNKRNIDHNILGGKLRLDATNCEMIYKDMITESLVNQVQTSIKYGLFTLIVPQRGEDGESIEIYLFCGVTFADPGSGRTTEEQDPPAPM